MAACFYEPDRQLFLEEELAEKLEHLLESLSPEGAAAARRMQSCLHELDQKKLSIDHAALFVGPFELLAAPYGSVYIEQRRTVMENSTIHATRSYQEAGLSVDVKEPPDHIAVELEFMYYLCSKEATAASDDIPGDTRRFRNQQREFYRGALKPWAHTFCEAIRRGTENGFYVNLADCLDHFLLSCEQLYCGEQTVKTP